MIDSGTESIAAESASPRGVCTLAILGYHKIGAPSPGGWETWYYVPEAVFVRQLNILQDQGFQMIEAATLERVLDGSEGVADRAALLTFDDGYRSVREVALPWLVRFGYPAVLFVPTRFIGGYNTFDAAAEPIEATCDWDQLHELDQNGVSIQSHGVSHRAFSELLAVEQEDELRESKRILEAGLNKPVTLFAYPYGDTGKDPRRASQQLLNAGYRAACVYDNNLNYWPIRQRYRLSRLTMGSDTDLEGLLSSQPVTSGKSHMVSSEL